MNEENKTCVVCESDLRFKWSDTHGIAVCYRCGMPYRLYHYDENDKRVDKPIEAALDDAGIGLAKRYWQEANDRVFPGVYDMGILSGRDYSYSGATRDQMDRFSAWYDANAKSEATS